MDGKAAEAIDIRYLLSSLLFWIICSALLLPAAALAAHVFQCGERGMAYISSSLSFITALAAGVRAIYVRRRKAVGTAVVSGVCIIILALTLGFIVAGERLDAAGVLSVVTFTVSGCMVGTVFFPPQKKQGQKRRFKTGRKRK